MLQASAQLPCLHVNVWKIAFISGEYPWIQWYDNGLFEFGVLCSLQGYLRGFKSAQLLLGVLNMKTAGIVVSVQYQISDYNII